MIPEQREALDEIIVKIRAGRMTRRTFLERAAAIGLSSTVAGSLLEACGGGGGGSNGGVTNIVWQSEQDSTNTYGDLANTFNQTIGKQKGIHVTWQQGPSSTNDMLTRYNNMLRARNSSIDVLSIRHSSPPASGQSQSPIASGLPASATNIFRDQSRHVRTRARSGPRHIARISDCSIIAKI